MSATLEQIMDELTVHAQRHPQARRNGGSCWNHHDGETIPCRHAIALAWLYKLTDHPLRSCETCQGYGWRWADDGPGGRASFDKVPCPNCGDTGLQNGLAGPSPHSSVNSSGKES